MRDTGGSGQATRSIAGGVLMGVSAAGVMVAWAWASDRPECSGEMFACLGEVVLVAALVVPAVLVLAWLGLRVLGTSNPALVVLSVLVVAVVVAPVIDPPLWAWPAMIGAFGCVVIARLGARSHPRP